MAEVLGSVEELLAGATERAPLTHTDGLSGSVLERVVIDGERYVVKHLDRRTDWLLRATGDTDCRAVTFWELGLYDAMPAFLDHTVVGAARDVARGPGTASLLMRDVGPWLVPEGNAAVSLGVHHRFLGHLAEQHALMWGWRDTVGLLSMTARYRMLAPDTMASEVAREDTHPVPEYMLGTWDRLRAASPRLAGPAYRLANDPAPLVTALAATPATFLQGDWKFGNLGAGPDGRTILIDWDRPGEGPPTYDLTWYLAVNCDRLPESKEASIAFYRAALESHGIDTAPWWDTQLALTTLGAFLHLGGVKADGDPAEFAWWEERAAAALALL